MSLSPLSFHEPSDSSGSASGTPAYGTLAEWSGHLASLGAGVMHARKIYRSWLGCRPWPGQEDESLPRRLREVLPEMRRRAEGVAVVRSRHPGSDSESERLLVALADGRPVESVLLPRGGVCVSTQMGCAVGCRFCMTGKGGLERQLTDIEIVAQAALARTLRPSTKKVVLMGMGEPSHNLANVFRAIGFLGEYGDFGHKNLVVSSVGDPRLFDALRNSKVRPALAVSLHTVSDETRRWLLPRGARMPVEDLMREAQDWADETGYPVQYEWTLIEGVNDSIEEAKALAQKLQGKYAMVNFIPVNAVEGSGFRRPARDRIRGIVRTVRSYGIIATIRDSAAQDVEGGCGQLRARTLAEEGH